jgi:hypothetical protein
MPGNARFMRILLINKFLYPKGGDAIVTLATGGLLRARERSCFLGDEERKRPRLSAPRSVRG